MVGRRQADVGSGRDRRLTYRCGYSELRGQAIVVQITPVAPRGVVGSGDYPLRKPAAIPSPGAPDMRFVLPGSQQT